MAGRRVFVLDTTALLSAQFEPGPAELVTVQEAVDEVMYGGLAPQRVFTALSTKAVKLKKPSLQAIKHVEETARKTGDLPKLSKTDLALLALAYEESAGGAEVVVVTDDYSLQNTALRLGLGVSGVGRETVREMREWVYRCLVCGKVYTRPVNRCRYCGGEVERIVKKP